MADQPDTKADAKPGRKLPKKALIIVLAVALLQGIGFFVFFKMAGSGPEPAHAEGQHAIEGAAAEEDVGTSEVALLRGYKVPNDHSGKVIIYDLDVSVVVAADRKKDMETIADERSGAIADRVARIVRGATMQMLTEPDLQILRDQFSEGLREIIEDEEFKFRVLIPRFVPIPS